MPEVPFLITDSFLREKFFAACLVAGIFLFHAQIVFAQENGQKMVLSGIVLDGVQFLPLEDINIVNFSNGLGTTTNYLGHFKMPFQTGDTIIFSAVGYQRTWSVLTSSLIKTGPEIRFFLLPDTVHIAEVQIVSRNYEHFKRQILAMTDIMDTMTIFIPGIPRRVVGPPAEPGIMNPISLIYNTFSKKARDQRRLERYRKIYQEKYH